VENRALWDPPPHPIDPLLSEFISNLKTTSTTHINNSRSFYNPLENLLHVTLNKLRLQKSIIFKPADKNLGLVKEMCLIHLNDTDTYKIITDYDPSAIYAKLIRMLRNSGNLFKKPGSPIHSAAP
jgi:hypothetical protein